MDKQERVYLRMRAEAEMEMANKAANPRAAKAHMELAGLYLERLEKEAANISLQHATAA